MTTEMESAFAADVAAVIADQPAKLKGAFGEMDVTSGVPQVAGSLSDAGYSANASVVIVGKTADLKGKELKERENVDLKLSGSSTYAKFAVHTFQYDTISFVATLIRVQGAPSGLNFL